MSRLPGSVRLDEEDVTGRTELLARQLVDIHGLFVPTQERPRTYEAWTAADRVRLPEGHASGPSCGNGPWRSSVARPRPTGLFPAPGLSSRQCPLHRPRRRLADHRGRGLGGDVLGPGRPGRGPLLHRARPAARRRRRNAPGRRLLGGRGSPRRGSGAHLYWRLLDALAFAPDAEKVAGPWRELGRHDLTPVTLTDRLEDYLQALFSRYG